MQLSRPIWKEGYGPLLVRVPIGLYFIVAARMKLGDIINFVHTVQSYNMMPRQLATLFGVLLPYIELVVGIFLVLGIFTTLTAVVGSLLVGCFIYAIGLFPNDPAVRNYLFNKDIILLAGTLSLLSTGAGAFSIDSFRKSG